MFKKIIHKKDNGFDNTTLKRSYATAESLKWTAQPRNPVETTEGQEVSLTWNYTLTADEQTASQTFFKVTWRKFNLGTSSFDEFAFYLKITGTNSVFTEPNAPRIVIDRSIGTSSASLQFKDVRLEDEGIYKIEVSVAFPGAIILAEQEVNFTVMGKDCSLHLVLSFLSWMKHSRNSAFENSS